MDEQTEFTHTEAGMEVDGEDIRIEIIHNVPNIEDAITNWMARTQEFTADSLAHYIRDKGEHIALTLEEYEEVFGRAVTDDMIGDSL